ncbi:TlpA family protein disulfide reductase [Singulisphaera rosea]
MNRSMGNGSARLAVALTLVASSVVVAETTPSPLPRYDLKPGREFRYRSSSEFDYGRGGYTTKIEWQGWVTRQNADGSSRVILRHQNQFISRSSATAGKSAPEPPPRVTIAYVDIFPDGRILENETLGTEIAPAHIFPALPSNAAQAKDRWGVAGREVDSRVELKPVVGDAKSPEVWSFQAEWFGPANRIYETKFQVKFAFDPKLGLIRSAETQNTQSYGIDGKGKGTTELVTTEQHNPGWTKTFADEADRYFAANQAGETLLVGITKDADRVPAIMAEFEKALTNAKESLTLPIFRDQLDQQIHRQKKLASYYTEEAKSNAKAIGRMAAEWTTTDLEGRSHSLTDYRGKVVILDFWSRGCGWCVQAMPQVKQLAEEFKDQPVAVLGMHTDSDEADARFVAEIMKLNYPSMKAESLPEKYHVRGFPTLFIVDQNGKIADIHVGYSPTLRAAVSNRVKQLLAGK